MDEEKRKASHSTCYFEFQKGYYHGKCWLPDSINISDSLWNEYHLSDLIACVIKNVDYYGTTIVTKNQCFFPVSSVRYPSSFSTSSVKSAFVLFGLLHAVRQRHPFCCLSCGWSALSDTSPDDIHPVHV